MSVEAVPGEADGTPAPIKLVHARAAPSICPLKDALSLDVGFSCSRDISQAHWNVCPSNCPLLSTSTSLTLCCSRMYEAGRMHRPA